MYRLQQVPIEIERNDPKPAQLKGFIKHVRENGIRVILVRPQFSIQKAEVVAQKIGAPVVIAEPLAEDWMANLREVADKLQSALG